MDGLTFAFILRGGEMGRDGERKKDREVAQRDK